jgi:hypothetical protein
VCAGLPCDAVGAAASLNTARCSFSQPMPTRLKSICSTQQHTEGAEQH